MQYFFGVLCLLFSQLSFASNDFIFDTAFGTEYKVSNATFSLQGEELYSLFTSRENIEQVQAQVMIYPNGSVDHMSSETLSMNVDFDCLAKIFTEKLNGVRLFDEVWLEELNVEIDYFLYRNSINTLFNSRWYEGVVKATFSSEEAESEVIIPAQSCMIRFEDINARQNVTKGNPSDWLIKADN